ncbi:PhzF family phenazine biosynthesis protein [Simiduia litorea]|uniref:PhzF family phenazine biosynthesis protein n=1 Tax=Simiduia litorea TaxID=1435348 RepID=UPI0036F32F58
MKVDVAIVNAFVDGDYGGNPAGVVLNADALTSTQKLKIARQVGLSETAFVSASNAADFKLDFYTPQKQIAHCGHATIATFSYLSQLGMIPRPNTSKETVDGTRSIRVDGNFAYMEQLAPIYRPLEGDDDRVLESLDISPEVIISTPIIVNTGNAFLLAGVKDLATLNNLTPNQSLIEELSEKYDLIGYYIFTLETNLAGRDAATRMFAPRYGINEESATGMAAGPLACLLFDRLDFKQTEFIIEQGYSMPSPSPSCIDVTLSIENSAIKSLMAGGIGIASRQMVIDIG